MQEKRKVYRKLVNIFDHHMLRQYASLYVTLAFTASIYHTSHYIIALYSSSYRIVTYQYEKRIEREKKRTLSDCATFFSAANFRTFNVIHLFVMPSIFLSQVHEIHSDCRPTNKTH